MKGVVVMLNPALGRYAAETAPGEYTCFELLDSAAPEHLDVVSGNLDRHAGETLRNETQCCDFEVYIERIGSTHTNAHHFVFG